jgi:hypothetical protein
MGDAMTRTLLQEMQSLPHWARVAFAARCALTVEPLFRRAWPNATAERQESVRAAIQLAEQSAATGRAADGLKAAMVESCATAGAAQLLMYPQFPRNEPLPTDVTACEIACCAAKVAEWAATAAYEGASKSVDANLEAYAFTRRAAEMAGAAELLDRLRHDLAALRRVATRGRWTDETPVPPSVFDLLAEEPPASPWWKFW